MAAAEILGDRDRRRDAAVRGRRHLHELVFDRIEAVAAHATARVTAPDERHRRVRRQPGHVERRFRAHGSLHRRDFRGGAVHAR